jgi:hypothetical protein
MALRFAVIVAGVSALGAAYWFTRPPELVWWRSPKLALNGPHIRLLVPAGWTADDSDLKPGPSGRTILDATKVVTIEPPKRGGVRWLRWMLPAPEEYAKVELLIGLRAVRFREMPGLGPENYDGKTHIYICSDPTVHSCGRGLFSSDSEWAALVAYDRSDESAFNRTYRQICNSLRIE